MDGLGVQQRPEDLRAAGRAGIEALDRAAVDESAQWGRLAATVIDAHTQLGQLAEATALGRRWLGMLERAGEGYRHPAAAAALLWTLGLLDDLLGRPHDGLEKIEAAVALHAGSEFSADEAAVRSAYARTLLAAHPDRADDVAEILDAVGEPAGGR